jgi:hypothetical protein
VNLHWQAAGGRPIVVGLQYPEGIVLHLVLQLEDGRTNVRLQYPEGIDLSHLALFRHKVSLASSVRLFSWVMYWVSRDLVIYVRVVVPWILTMHERPEQD